MDAIVAKSELRTHDLQSISFRKDNESDVEAQQQIGRIITFTTTDTNGGLWNKVTDLIVSKYSAESVTLQRLSFEYSLTMTQKYGSYGSSLDIELIPTRMVIPNYTYVYENGYMFDQIHNVGSKSGVATLDYMTNGLRQSYPILNIGSGTYASLGFSLRWVYATGTIWIKILDLKFTRFYLQFD